MTDHRVIVIGGGPAGFSSALFLTAAGIPVTLLERSSLIYSDPRAATFHPPTLELLAPHGVTDRLHEMGIIARHWQFRDRREGVVAEFDLEMLRDETPFPYRLQCEQHKFVAAMESILRGNDRLEIVRDADVIDVEQTAGGVRVVFQQGGEQQSLAADYAVGADGGRSVTRKSQGIDFKGFTYPERFLVITTTFDFQSLGYAFSSYTADPDEWYATFKVPGEGPPGLWRAVFPTDPEEDEAKLLSPDLAQARLAPLVGQPNPEIVHTNLYQVHQRVAECYRKDRVLLVGDAAHVNNPLGGMGMNFGIHDAANLADKLRAVIAGKSSDLLDRFDRQRRTVAEQYLQAMTIQNKKNLEEKDPAARARRMKEMRATANDLVASKAYLMNTSMIEGFRAAAAIT